MRVAAATHHAHLIRFPVTLANLENIDAFRALSTEVNLFWIN